MAEYIVKTTLNPGENFPNNSRVVTLSPTIIELDYVAVDKASVHRFVYVKYSSTDYMLQYAALYLTSNVSDYYLFNDNDKKYLECDKDGYFPINKFKINYIATLPTGFSSIPNEVTCENQLDFFHFDDVAQQVTPVACDCGTWKTYGQNADISLHSQWCSLRKKA